jgi:eukaryotic-like serine/threonine-protein kinase
MSQLQQLGRYKIEEHIGAGAYADVYRATDATLKRTVALKVLILMLLAHEEAFARFVQEVQTAAGLFHPQFATVLDLGEDQGRYFLAMRFVDGASLDQVLSEGGPLPWDQALQFIEQIAGALQFAHDKGFVHRDVKSQNMLISQSKGAVLTDFGLVKAIATSGLTTTGSFLGTPHYMPPEIWKGEETTPVVDQYALACVFVEMLFGAALHVGTTPPAVMAKHFQPPDFPEHWPGDMPAGTEEILAKALLQDADDRYLDMVAFIKAIKADKTTIKPTQPEEVVSKPVSPLSVDFEEQLGLVTSDNPAGIELVEIPKGEFLYGDKKENQLIEQSYLMGKYTVTNAQYKIFIDTKPMSMCQSIGIKGLVNTPMAKPITRL